MPLSRREFIKQFGVLLGSVALTLSAPLSGRVHARTRLRRCWSSLKQLQGRTWRDPERGRAIRDQLLAEHRVALDHLVAIEELDADVAEHVQSIFDAAVQSIWRSGARVTCYLSVGLPVRRFTSLDRMTLLKRVETLQGIASRKDIAPETISRAQAAIEQEMASLARLGKPGSAMHPDIAQAALFLVELLLRE